jgi:hypothetical protein
MPDFTLPNVPFPVTRKDKAAWLALWNRNGKLEDPVGASPLDPEGAGINMRLCVV